MRKTADLTNTPCRELLSEFDFSKAGMRVFSRHGIPLLILPRCKHTAELTVGLYLPQSPIARICSRLLNAAVKNSLIRFFLPALASPSYPERGDTNGNLPFSQKDVDDGKVGFLLCNPAHGGRLVAVVNDAGNVRIVKWGKGSAADIECALLEKLAKSSIRGVPEVTGHGHIGGTSWFSMEYLAKADVKSVADPESISLLRSWMSDESIPVTEFAAISEAWTPEEAAASGLSRLRVHKAFIHGDYAPWNLRRGKDGLTAVDFEWSDCSGIAGFDFCYGLIRESMLVKKLSPKETLETTESQLRNPEYDDILSGWRGHEKLLAETVMRYIGKKDSIGADSGKALRKTGTFIAMEGADGVGKSTVMKLAVPELVKAGKYNGYAFFHWKPVKGGVHVNCIPGSEPHNPRGNRPRDPLSSLVYLAYHWITFMTGYILRIRPILKSGGLVIADRYTYDMVADQRRFRLCLPDSVMRMFVRLLPQPDAMLLLVAKPETIIARKPELTVDEIAAYQDVMRAMHIRGRRCTVDAEGTPEFVAAASVAAVISSISR